MRRLIILTAAYILIILAAALSVARGDCTCGEGTKIREDSLNVGHDTLTWCWEESVAGREHTHTLLSVHARNEITGVEEITTYNIPADCRFQHGVDEKFTYSSRVHICINSNCKASDWSNKAYITKNFDINNDNKLNGVDFIYFRGAYAAGLMDSIDVLDFVYAFMTTPLVPLVFPLQEGFLE